MRIPVEVLAKTFVNQGAAALARQVRPVAIDKFPAFGDPDSGRQVCHRRQQIIHVADAFRRNERRRHHINLPLARHAPDTGPGTDIFHHDVYAQGLGVFLEQSWHCANQKARMLLIPPEQRRVFRITAHSQRITRRSRQGVDWRQKQGGSCEYK